MTGQTKRGRVSTDPAGEFPLDLTTYLFHVFAVLSRYRDAELDKALAVSGLNTTRHRAISVIARLQPCTMTELADFSAVDRTTMTRTVDPLVASGLVERTTPSTDRRRVVLTLTDAGHEAYRQGLKSVYRLNNRLLREIPEDVQRTVIRAKQRMVANLVADPVLTERLLMVTVTGPASAASPD